MKLKVFYFLCLAACLQPTLASAVIDKVVYDEYASVSFSQFFLISEVTTSPYQGKHSLLVEPNQWQTPYMRISPGRTDFRPYDVLEFMVRSPYAQINPQFIAYDYASSNTIDIAQYTQSKVVDATWRKVSIPIADMISPAFAMDSVFLMRFSPMNNASPFYMDNMVLRSTSTPTLKFTVTHSDRAVMLAFVDFSIALTQAGIYTVQSPDDLNYNIAQTINVMGMDRQAIGTPIPVPGRNPNTSINESRLHLLLPFPMQAGKHYQVNYHDVRRDNAMYPTSAITTIVYDPTLVNGSVQVNQVGYMPSAPKRALVGNWLGSAGGMPVDHYTFQVVDAYSQTVAFQGTLTARAVPDEQSGNNVYVADFSGLTLAGRYYVHVAGIGRSYTFDIQPDVFESVYRTTMRVLYHKRNSALVAPYVDAGRERIAGIPATLDGVFHPDLYATPLYNGEQANAYKKIEAGWFDAGDLGEYITNQAPIWSSISLALDLASPNSFQDGELNIPESGNAIPDIIDELSWGSRWALSMQDQRDGGVYWRICSGSWDYVPPFKLTQPRYIYEKTSVATAQFSAMMAIYARLIAPYDAYASANAAQASLQAWDYLNTHVQWPAEGSTYHNPSVASGCGEYPVSSVKPAKFWAAAELYRLTGDAQYQTAFESIFNTIQNPQIANMYPGEIGDASWAMLMSQHTNRDPYLTQLGRQMIMVGADSMWERMDVHPFYSTKHPFLGFTGWHSFSASAISATKLLRGYYITHDIKYRDAAWTTPNIELGTNPQNRSYLVGVGYNPPLSPLDTSFTDPYAKVIRGGLVPGVTYHLPGFRQPYIDVNSAYYPPESTGNPTPWISNDWFAAYPVLRRYTDAWSLIPMAESTVKEEVWNAVSFALMRNENLPTQTSAQAYPWFRKQGFIAIAFSHIPLSDVPLLSPARIAAFGTSIGSAPVEWLHALTPQQVGSIAMPNGVHWVGSLTALQKEGLTAMQIASFSSATLLLDLLPQQVPWIPVNSLLLIKNVLPTQNVSWMQNLTLPQLQEIQLNLPQALWQANLSSTQLSLLDGSLVDTSIPVIQLGTNTLIVMRSSHAAAPTQSHPDISAWLNHVVATDDTGLVGTVWHNAPASFPDGDTKVTFKAIDAAGKIGTATAILTVKLKPLPTPTPTPPSSDIRNQGKAGCIAMFSGLSSSAVVFLLLMLLVAVRQTHREDV